MNTRRIGENISLLGQGLADEVLGELENHLRELSTQNTTPIEGEIIRILSVMLGRMAATSGVSAGSGSGAEVVDGFRGAWEVLREDHLLLDIGCAVLRIGEEIVFIDHLAAAEFIRKAHKNPEPFEVLSYDGRTAESLIDLQEVGAVLSIGGKLTWIPGPTAADDIRAAYEVARDE